MTTIRATIALALWAWAAPAGAQQSVSEILAFLVTNQSIETGAVERDQAAAEAAGQTISRALRASLATLPVSSSSGGFVYRLNPELGTVQRASESFGPFFVERAMTAGRGAAAVGLTFQHLRFSALDGRRLRDGSFVTTANQFVDEAEPFDVDELALAIDADVATIYGNLGLTNSLEIGAALPFVALRVAGSRVNTYRGRAFTQATASATAMGPADLVLRTKYTLFSEDALGLAAAGEVRLPTGREENLLGAGTPSVRLSAVGSLERGRISSHANAGLTVGGLAREASFAGAVAFAAGPAVTLTGELLARFVEGPGRITQSAAPHPTLAGVQTLRLIPGAGHLAMVNVAPGLKWNLTDTWVLVTSVSVPVTNGGLTTRATPFIGVDYAVEW